MNVTHDTGLFSQQRRLRIMAEAQAMLDHMVPFEQTRLSASCAGLPAPAIEAARAQHDRLVAEMRKEATDPAPREITFGPGGVARYSW